MKTFTVFLCSFFLVLGLATNLLAVPFSFKTILTGDFRTKDPNGLIVDVTIDHTNGSRVATWTVDINSPLHPDIKLDAFYFNLALPDGVDVFLGEFIPANSVKTNAGRRFARIREREWDNYDISLHKSRHASFSPGLSQSLPSAVSLNKAVSSFS